MTRYHIYVLLCFFFLLNEYAHSQDTTITPVGPTHTWIHIYNQQALHNINILEIDISKPGNMLTSVLANDQLGNGFERTTSMVQRSSECGTLAIGGINADFFGIHNPDNPFTFLSSMMVREGEIVTSRIQNRPMFGLTDTNAPVLAAFNFTGQVITPDTIYTIDGINREQDLHSLMLYNHFIGTSPPTDEIATEINIKPLDKYKVNAPMQWKVTAIENGSGDQEIHHNEYLLSALGDAKEFATTHLSVGDTIAIILGTIPEIQDIHTLVGGNPWLVRDGENITSEGGELHPRTAIGINKDSTMVFMVTIDGRLEDFSIGMTLEELADLMISIGCHYAINLDGGGSTTMVIRDEMVNYQFWGERSVANALVAVANVSVKDIIDTLKIFPPEIQIGLTEKQLLELQAIDKWGYTLAINHDDIEWSLKNINGHINEKWKFIPEDTGTGYLIGSIGSVADTISVRILETTVSVYDQNTQTKDTFTLNQNYPNPFNPITSITYMLPEPGYVTLSVYNILGSEIARLVDTKHSPGIYTVTFDATDIPSGVYFYTLRANGFTKTMRMVISK